MKKCYLFVYASILTAGCIGGAAEIDGQGAQAAAGTQSSQSELNLVDPIGTASTLDIMKLKSQYSFAVDLVAKDPSQIAQLTSLMTDDVVVNYGPSGTFTGKAQVTFFFQSVLPQVIAWSFHTPLNPIITVASPTTASGDWYVHALGVYKTAYQAGPQPVYGRYHDTYVRTAQGWKFRTITLTIDTPPTGP